MKKLVLTLVVFFTIVACSQKKSVVENYEILTQTISKKKGMQLVLKNIFNDSRCPEGVNCFWAGEIEIVVSVYNDNNFLRDTHIKFSPKLQQENLAWFSEFYPSKKIKEIEVLPYPKSEIRIQPKDYFVKIYFLN